MKVEIKLSKKDIEMLETLSADRGLLTFYDDETALKKHVRKLYFPDMTSKIATHYYALSENNQHLIGRLVKKLAMDQDHHGFNFTLYLRWFTKSNGDGPYLNQSIISKLIAEMERTIQTSEQIKSGISKLKKDEKIKEDRVHFEDLRDNLLFDASLIVSGAGYIEVIKTEVLEEYYQHPEFYTKNRITVEGRVGRYLKNTTVRKELADFAEYVGRKWEDMVDRKYCVINYTYMYAFLDEVSRELVDDLIEVLYEDNKGAELLVGLYQNIIDGTIRADTDDE